MSNTDAKALIDLALADLITLKDSEEYKRSIWILLELSETLKN